MWNFFRSKSEPAVAFFKTDIHCHVVPGVDDGSPNVAKSIDLVERMRGLGFNRIIASPHVTAESFENTPEILDAALARLNDALAERALNAGSKPFVVERSAEYRIDDFFKEQLAKGLITTLPQKYILIENSFLQEPFDLENVVFDLKTSGMKPILAHPERYGYYADRRRRLEQLHDNGLMFQVNLLSLAGYYGKGEKQMAEYLAQKGFIDFLGTDIHSHRHIDCLEGYFSTRNYRSLAEKLHVRNDDI